MNTSTSTDININNYSDIPINTRYVYFFTNGVNIKIGYTKNSVKKRLKQLNTGSDMQLYYLGYLTGSKQTEKLLHQKFAHLKVRANGEWFKADDSLLDYINSINEEPNCYVGKNEYLNNRVMQFLSIGCL